MLLVHRSKGAQCGPWLEQTVKSTLHISGLSRLINSSANDQVFSAALRNLPFKEKPKSGRAVPIGTRMSTDLLVRYIDLWEAHISRTNLVFDQDPAYVSCKSTLELLVEVVIETQTSQTYVGPQSTTYSRCTNHIRSFFKSTMEEGRLTSFAEYGKTTDNSGGLAVIFLSENSTKNRRIRRK